MRPVRTLASIAALVLAAGGFVALAAPTAPPEAMAPARLDLDRDRDGYPDAAELRDEADRRAFAESFVALALAQAPVPEPTWDPTQRDCAGLVRYAYREALKRHDAAFAARHPGVPRLPEVRAWNYPDVPGLGTRLFRTGAGAFDPRERVSEVFDAAPEALRLALGSARRTERPPQPADLLLFRPAPDRAHLMILSHTEPEAWVVYHTGPREDGSGEVRRVRLETLEAHPDPGWRPVRANPAFVGRFRFKILEGP